MDNLPIDGPTALRLRSAMGDVQAELIESVAGVDKMIASLSAQRAELIQQAHQWAQVTVDQVIPVGQTPARRVELAERSFIAEIACALRMSEQSAQKLVAESDTLVQTLSASFTALSQGRIGYAHARAIIDEAYGLSNDDRHELEDAVLEAAAKETPSRLRIRARRVREGLHPETITARVRAAVADRSMTADSGQDGMGWLNLYLQAPLIAGIDDRITQVATLMKENGDPRTMAQLRADIAAMLLLSDGTGVCTDASTDTDTDTDGQAATGASEAGGSDADGSVAAGDSGVPVGAGYRHGAPGSAMEPLAALLSQVRPEMDVSVPVLTLLGVSELPGTLNGVIPIDADTARHLAAAAPSFTRILTDPETGVILSVGRKRYRPPPDLARYIRLRDGTCRFPGCNRRARRTEIDHTIQRQDGGPTQWDNLACLCARHHHLKDETAWQVVQLDNGVLQWTSPAGRVYTTDPQLELPVPDMRELESRTTEPDGDGDDVTAPF